MTCWFGLISSFAAFFGPALLACFLSTLFIRHSFYVLLLSSLVFQSKRLSPTANIAPDIRKPPRFPAAALANTEVAFGATRIRKSISRLQCSFNATAFAVATAILKTVKRFFNLGNRDCVFTTWKTPLLETAQPVEHDGQQRFVRDAVEAYVLNWSLLKFNDGDLFTNLARVEPERINVACSADALFIGQDMQMFSIESVDVVIRDFSCQSYPAFW